MLDSLLTYLRERSVTDLGRDALDIFLVYYVFYRALLVLRGTRAIQVGIGLALVFVLYVFAQTLQLDTMSSVLGMLVPEGAILVVVVVFQNDIRRALMRMGSQTWMSGSKAKESQAIDEVVEAATELARHRTGAIIAFEQEANLDEFVGTNKGHTLDAVTTRELLVSIFIPESMNKLHDGAVIIRDLRIAKAGVFFPMPDSRVVDASFGSRHRAALGITEETDAVVVVVSEERGSISFCFNGNIVGNLDGPGLRRALDGVFSPKRRKKKKTAARPREASQSQLSVSEAEPLRPSVAEEEPLSEAAPVSEEAPPSRLRTLESEPEAHDSQPPPPLRKARPEKSDDAASSTTATSPRLPRTVPISTPLRSATGGRPEGAPMPRANTPEKTSTPSGKDDTIPDSEQGDPA